MFNIFKKKSELHPDYPIVDSRYEMTNEWSITPSQPFNRRFEDDQLVLWRPGITAWIIIWGNDNNKSIDIRLNSLKSRRSPQTFAEKESKKNGVGFYTYRLNESSEDNRVPALYCFAFSNEGHVQMAIYFDKESDSVIAENLCNSIEYTITENINGM